MRNLIIIALIAMPVVGACKPQGQAAAESAAVSHSASSSKVANEQSESAARSASQDEDSNLDAERDRDAHVGMPDGITTEYYNCLKDGGYRYLESMNCLTDEMDRQDRRLNLAYKNLLQKLDVEQKKMAVKTQQEWLRSRNDDADFEARLYGGGTQPENGQAALNELIRLTQRANLINMWLGAADL